MFVHLKNNIEVSLSKKDDSIAISLRTLVMLPQDVCFANSFLTTHSPTYLFTEDHILLYILMQIYKPT